MAAPFAQPLVPVFHVIAPFTQLLALCFEMAASLAQLFVLLLGAVILFLKLLVLHFYTIASRLQLLVFFGRMTTLLCLSFYSLFTVRESPTKDLNLIILELHLLPQQGKLLCRLTFARAKSSIGVVFHNWLCL